MSETGNVMHIEADTPFKISEVICIHCKRRWIAIRPEGTMLKDIECPSGHIPKTGYVIETGEEIVYGG